MTDDDPAGSGTRTGHTATEEVGRALERAIDEGELRLGRTWPSLLATGAVGGLDVGLGVLGLLIVSEATGSRLLGGLGFSIGFIALSLANSELFTENFLVPVVAVAARRARPVTVLRLWLGTGAANLLGGWTVTGLVMAGLPRLRATAVTEGVEYIRLGIGGELFARSILAGMVITLMTWMEHSTESVPARLVAVISAAFVLTASPLAHAVVGSLTMFAALQAGAPFGYRDWLGSSAWITLGNLIGGIGLVTVLRLVQVGKDKLEEERTRA